MKYECWVMRWVVAKEGTRHRMCGCDGFEVLGVKLLWELASDVFWSAQPVAHLQAALQKSHFNVAHGVVWLKVQQCV